MPVMIAFFAVSPPCTTVVIAESGSVDMVVLRFASGVQSRYVLRELVKVTLLG